MDDKELNLKTLEELILDEERLVTYAYLSKKLCIHVNDSKNLLLSFVNKFKSAKPNESLYVNYIVSGLIDNNKARTIVCSDDEVAIVKKELNPIFYEHIYSVSKATQDNNIILSVVNKYSDFRSCLGLIKNTSCSKYSSSEIDNLKLSSYTLNNQKASTKKVNQETVLQEKNGETKIKVESKSETSVNNNNVISPKKVKVSNSPIKNNKTQTKKGIAGFFNKQNSVKKEVKLEDTKKNESVEVSKNIEINSSNNTLSDVCSKEIKKESPKNKSASKSITNGVENKNGKSLTNNSIEHKAVKVNKKKAKVDKKRKRLLEISDSESDEDQKEPFEDEEDVTKAESEDEIPPTPTTNVVKVTSGIINPKKKRKFVDKVYTDEDGYILTKKEEVYESCSDNEEPMEVVNDVKNTKEERNLDNKPKLISPNNKTETNKKKKISPPQKGRQSTLMSFFTKK